MSEDPRPDEEQQGEPEVTGFGVYHPQAAHHGPYNDAMAAWHNQVAAMGQPPAQELAEMAPEAPLEQDQEYTSPESSEAPEDDGGAVSEDTHVEDLTPEPETAEETEFDPSAHNAPAVLDYLKGVGTAEAERVLTAEEQGKARLGILNLKDQILAKAASNDSASNE